MALSKLMNHVILNETKRRIFVLTFPISECVGPFKLV